LRKGKKQLVPGKNESGRKYLRETKRRGGKKAILVRKRDHMEKRGKNYAFTVPEWKLVDEAGEGRKERPERSSLSESPSRGRSFFKGATKSEISKSPRAQGGEKHAFRGLETVIPSGEGEPLNFEAGNRKLPKKSEESLIFGWRSFQMGGERSIGTITSRFRFQRIPTSRLERLS